MKKLFALLISLVLGLAIYGRYIEPYRLRVRTVAVPLPRKHAHLNGLRIAFVSDTHVGPHFSASHLEPLVARLQHIKPDLILFGGDYVAESARFSRDIVEPFNRMAQSAPLGAFAILGNHDISNVRYKTEEAIRAAGIQLLVNESRRFSWGNGEFWIVGVDDALLGKPDLKHAFAEVPADGPAIAMWHEPDVAPRLAEFAPLLHLAGHSHGGQIRIPGIGEIAAPTLGKRYPDGQYHIEDMLLIVSRGVGVYRPPMRINCPPELVLIHCVS